MADLYLVDKPFGGNGLKIAAADKDALIVLIQDGVFLDLGEFALFGRRLYALRADTVKRGLAERLPAAVELIDIDRLVDLIVANKVVNFA